MSKAIAALVALACLLLASSAAAEPIRFKTPVTCEAHPSGNRIDLEPGRYLPERDWITLDSSIIELQNQATRYEAERVELLKPDPMPWKLVLAGTLIGIAAGAYAFRN